MFGITAYAAEATPAVGGAAGGIASFIPFILIFIVFYFFLIRPQKKKDKETKQMLSELGNGDIIVTIGGIKGKIVKVKDDEIIIVTGKIGTANESSTMKLEKWAVRNVVKKNEKGQMLDEPEIEPDEEVTAEE